MDTTVFISLAGLISTVAASAIGFYFTHKSQRTPLRQELYKQQIDCLFAFIVQATRMQQLAGSFASGTSTFESGADEDMAWETLNAKILEITQRGGLVLPAAAYSTLTAYRAAQRDFEDSLIENADLGPPLQSLQGALGHVFMVGREVVGADSLSVESIRLHSQKGYENMSRVGASALGDVISAMWRQGHKKGKNNNEHHVDDSKKT
jgi:hypothetical protein